MGITVWDLYVYIFQWQRVDNRAPMVFTYNGIVFTDARGEFDVYVGLTKIILLMIFFFVLMMVDRIEGKWKIRWY